MDFTPIARPFFLHRIKAHARYARHGEDIQRRQLAWMVMRSRNTLWGQQHNYTSISSYEDYARLVPISPYARLRPYVERMISGQRDILWPGHTPHYAQSSGTSDGKSKYIPITSDSFNRCHYRGSSDVVSNYLHLYPDSRIFSGKAFILGGSFANELNLPKGVYVGDLSANLINKINPIVNLLRVPSKDIALMHNWDEKLPALVEASLKQNITNISGVPSWFLTVLKKVISKAGATTIHDVWPNLEVFFHGGISFTPYREQYDQITDRHKMRYLETYNASEGFFAVQNAIDDPAMLLLLDVGVFYEFIPITEVDNDCPTTLPIWEIEPGKVYALVITSCNGLWRYPIGDTVKVESINPVKITITGRTKHYINAFGEELMVYNADTAIANTCRQLKCSVANYTAAPVFAGNETRGRHEWLIEFSKQPDDTNEFMSLLDKNLQNENSDYQAKRDKDIFLDPPSLIIAQKGLFDSWLASTGKLGGQRKVPRLSNDRRFIDPMLSINNLIR
ncbi:MAG: GH3 auxin-responsive promoter family protein [Muribaculaceae bacterium]|nr:GH3 auxin-responsive promoter family protein [Muribaculaceae bacterium]